MSKAKLDKGDQQLELVGVYIIAFFKGIVAGIKKIIKEQDKMLLFVMVTLVSGVIFYLRQSIGERLAPGAEFHVIRIALLAAPTLPIDGNYPIFKGKETEGKKVIYTFYSPGITVFEWRSRESELENVLNCMQESPAQESPSY